MPIFTPEEKKRIIKSLQSSVTATRFMALKHLAKIARELPQEYERLELEDPKTLEELLFVIHDIEILSTDETLKREANICLNTIKSKLGPKYRKNPFRCASCKKYLCYGWNHCPYCGVLVHYREGTKCPDCEMSIGEEWIYCVRCGKKVKEISVPQRCKHCSRETMDTWIICPYCGKTLR